MNRTPKRWLAVAGICAMVFFLLGAPEISDNTGVLGQIGMWAQAIVALAGLVALALTVWGLFVRRAPEK